jgi:hypothetical protein
VRNNSGYSRPTSDSYYTPCVGGCSQTSGGPWDYRCSNGTLGLGAQIQSDLYCNTSQSGVNLEFGLNLYFGCIEWGSVPLICNFNYLQPRTFFQSYTCGDAIYLEQVTENFYNNRSAGASYFNPFNCSDYGSLTIIITE